MLTTQHGEGPENPEDKLQGLEDRAFPKPRFGEDRGGACEPLGGPGEVTEKYLFYTRGQAPSLPLAGLLLADRWQGECLISLKPLTEEVPL